MVLGQQQVQGVDYAYTIQGWLKGINSTSVGDGTYDMGEDGKSGSMHSNIARDAFGFSLNYYNGDYTSINTNPFATISNSLPLRTDNIATGKDLFNGNIRAMLVNIPKLGDAQLYGYSYDQLNRITAMNTFMGLSGNSFTAIGTDNYLERITYDANGNILTYLRNGDAARVSMDEMTYTYKANTNQLDKVVDIAADETTNYAKYNDIKQGQANGNYEYDAIGNLIGDVSENITNIVWNVYGKIQSIEKSSGDVDYSYDASGNRISKTHNGKTTWYVRDASGNVMSIYVKDAALNDNHLTQNEVHLYGSSRLGILNVDEDMEVVPPVETPVITRGDKFFELSNHLGNVLVTISDKKIAFAQASPNEEMIDYYEADVVTANDYYPFGMQIPLRKFDAGSEYRYGFNGKEIDKETLTTTTYDYGFRIYNPGLGKFLSVDPLSKNYPFYSPYQYSSNNPVFSIDIDGLEAEKILNAAESLLFTPYEFGGKKPHPSLIGYINTENGRKEWVDKLRPKLQKIAANHPNLNKRSTWSDYSKAKESAYNEFKNYVDGGYNLGIDCSGFVFTAYGVDKTLKINPANLESSSGQQLDYFRKEMTKGNAYVHKDFNLVSAGDFIYKPGHVMIATGRVKVDENGIVLEFETMEAHNTQEGSIIKWRTASKEYTIGHSFRSTDEYTSEAVKYNKSTGQTSIETVELSGRERVLMNQELEIVE